MLKSEAENIIKRVAEESGVEFSEEQVKALALIVMKIAGRMIEEAFSSYRPNVPGSRPSFFTE